MRNVSRFHTFNMISLEDLFSIYSDAVAVPEL